MKQDMLLTTVAVAIMITAKFTSPVDGIFDPNGIADTPKHCWTGLPKGCYDTVPGFDKMMLGIDITELDLFPLSSKQPGGFRNPVINVICANKTYQTPSFKSQRPEQIKEILDSQMGTDVAHATVIKSSSDVKKFLSVSVSGSGSSAMGAFSMSASASYKHMERTITEHQRSVQYASVIRSVNKINYKESNQLQLDPLAQLVFDNLPETFESNRVPYEQFIENYGTHYFHSASFGGTVTQYQETKKDYAYKLTQQDLETEAKASFYGMVTVSVGVEAGRKKVSDEFKTSTVSSTRYFGGNTNLLDKDGLSSWQSSLKSDPWLMSGSLTSITELIKHDDHKKGQLKKAIDEYIMRKQLTDLFRKVNRASEKYKHVQLNLLTRKLRALEKSEFLVLDRMIKVSKDIEYNLDVPGWFYSTTKFCFSASHNNKDYCRQAGDYCGVLNSNTLLYYNTMIYEKKAQNCKFRWRISSSGQSEENEWLKSIKVCFRVSGPGENKCGGTKFSMNTDVCAKVNEFTAPFDSGRISNNCHLRWSLRIPDRAPLWLKLMKFCFSFSPLGGGCRGAGPEICVNNNQWTSAFAYTNNQYEHCTMSWGLFLDL